MRSHQLIVKDNTNFLKLSKKIQNKVIGLSEAKFQGQLNLFVHVFSINTIVAAVTWLKYCHYGVKPYAIKQSIIL